MKKIYLYAAILRYGGLVFALAFVVEGIFLMTMEAILPGVLLTLIMTTIAVFWTITVLPIYVKIDRKNNKFILRLTAFGKPTERELSSIKTIRLKEKLYGFIFVVKYKQGKSDQFYYEKNRYDLPNIVGNKNIFAKRRQMKRIQRELDRWVNNYEG